MFGLTNVGNNDKSKYVYRGLGIGFDELGSWSFVKDFARNVIIFGVDKSSSSHTADDKNCFFVLGKRPIKGSIGAAKKKLVLISVKQR